MMLLSLDPAKHKLPWALWRDGVLSGVGMPRCDSELPLEKACVALAGACGIRLAPWDLVVMEQPQVYGRLQDQKGDQNDLIEVGIAGAYVAATLGGQLRLVKPSQWKGQMPKRLTEPRVRARLSAQECVVLDRGLEQIPPSLRHNVYDAAGIGLHELRRWR